MLHVIISTLLIFGCLTTISAQIVVSDSCNEPVTAEGFDQVSCLGYYYHYGGTTPYSYTCIFRNCTIQNNDIMAVYLRDWYIKRGQVISVEDGVARRISDDFLQWQYGPEGTDGPIVNTIAYDCQSYMVLKARDSDDTWIVTREKNPSTPIPFPSCGQRIYRYYPDRYCR